MDNETKVPFIDNFLFNRTCYLCHDNAFSFCLLLFLKVKAVIGKNDEAITDFETVSSLLIFMQQHVLIDSWYTQ